MSEGVRRVSCVFTAFAVSVIFLACRGANRTELSLANMQSLESLLRQGVLMLRKGDRVSLQRAEAAFELGYELAPDDPRVLDGLGAVAFLYGRQSSAKQRFEQAIRSSPKYARAYVHLALVAERRGDKMEALRLLREALRLDPLEFRGRNNLAGILFDGATTSEERAVALQELLKARFESPLGDRIIEENIKRMRTE